MQTCDSYLNAQLNHQFRKMEQAEDEMLWLEQRIEYIRNNLSEYSIGDLLADYADSNVPNHKGIGPNPKHWGEYDRALDAVVLHGDCKWLQEFAEKALQFQAQKELEELKRTC